MSGDDTTVSWDYLAGEAKAGRMRLDPEVARIYSEACQELVAELTEAHSQISRAGHITGLGDFECARQLEAGLTDLFVGPNDSIAARITQYIEVAKKIHETVSYSVAKLHEQDHDNASHVNVPSAGL
jgi:hypothetical protein